MGDDSRPYFDLRAFSDDLEEVAAYYKEVVQGTVESPWEFLKHATASSVFAAHRAFGELCGLHARFLARGDQAAGGIELLLNFHYSVNVSGPILACHFRRPRGVAHMSRKWDFLGGLSY